MSTADLADFRQKLIEAAGRIFAAKGREGFTLRELAGELGVSAMTPYRYFKDKEEILAAVRADAFDRFAQALEQAAARPGSAIEKSNAVGEAYIAFAFGDPAAYRLMFDMTQPEETSYPDLARAATRSRATMTGHVRGLIDDGVLQGDPILIGHVFWAALHGAVVLQLAGKLGPECDFQTIASTSFRALADGFRTKAHAPTLHHGGP